MTDNIVVVGLGPTGLAAALETAQNDVYKRPIIAITDRNEYTRDQFLIIRDHLLKYFEKLVGKDAVQKFKAEKVFRCETNRGTFITTQLNEVEELLYHALCKYKNVEIVHAPKRMVNSTIDLKSNTIHLSATKDAPARTISFDYLISADGAHHQLENQIPEISYQNHHNAQLTGHNIGVQFHIPEGETEAFEEQLQKTRFHPMPDYKLIKKFKPYGWQEASAPESIVIIKNGELSVGSECIAGIAKDELEHWAKLVLELYFPEEMLKALTVKRIHQFLTPLMLANQSVIKSDSEKNPAYFFCIGDALHSQQYQTGSGARTGFAETAVLGKFFASEQKEVDLQQYQTDLQAVVKKGCTKIDRYLMYRFMKNANAMSAKMEFDRILAVSHQAKSLLTEMLQEANHCYLNPNLLYKMIVDAYTIIKQFDADLKFEIFKQGQNACLLKLIDALKALDNNTQRLEAIITLYTPLLPRDCANTAVVSSP